MHRLPKEGNSFSQHLCGASSQLVHRRLHDWAHRVTAPPTRPNGDPPCRFTAPPCSFTALPCSFTALPREVRAHPCHVAISRPSGTSASAGRQRG
eukprot:2916982-Prymnesium_polylepis.3